MLVACKSEIELSLKEPHTCSIPLSPAFDDEPLAKHVVREFDWYLMTQAAFVTRESQMQLVQPRAVLPRW